MSNTPYDDIQGYQSWYHEVRSRNEIPLEVRSRRKVDFDRDTKCFSMGSCFAARVADYLVSNHYKYLRFYEETFNESEKSLQQYSANYSNIYTVRHLYEFLDFFLRADEETFSSFMVAKNEDRYIDLFRTNAIGCSAFKTISDLVRSRVALRDHLFLIMAEADVFIFTLGLTEGWLNKPFKKFVSGTPGLNGSLYNIEQYEFVNLTFVEMSTHLSAAISLLKSYKPTLKVVLTVSPVALAATYEDRSVIQSNCVSKGKLRALADEFEKDNHDVYYFPSYEIATHPKFQYQLLSDNFRDINQAGIDYIMTSFISSSVGHGDGVRQNQNTNQINAVIECDDDVIERQIANVGNIF